MRSRMHLMALTHAVILLTACADQLTAQKHKKSGSFNAPFIYSLANDSSTHISLSPVMDGRQDTIKVKTDSIIIVTPDTAAAQKMNGKLDSIQLQVSQIKKILWWQAFEVRYRQLLFQRDSVRQFRMRVQQQKNLSNEDRLKIQVYTLQEDSISNELLQLHQRMDAGGLAVDSLMIVNRDSHYLMEEKNIDTVNENTISQSVVPGNDTVTATDTLSANDTLTAAQQQIIEEKIRSSQLNERYRADSSYRAKTDSLEQKLKTYRLLLEKQVSAVPALQGDSAAEDSMRLMMSGMNNSLQKNNDSLIALRKSVQQARDSASFYRQQLAAANNNIATGSANRKKWYNRIIPGRSATKQRAALDETAEASSSQLDYYDRQVQTLNDKMDRMQRRNESLANDYQDYGKRQRYSVRTYSNPAPAVMPVIIPAINHSNNNEELARLSNEITTLNNQLQLNHANSNNPGRDTIFVKGDTQVTTLKNELAQMKLQFQEYKDASTAKLAMLQAGAAKREAPESIQPPSKLPSQVTIYFASGSAAVTALQNEKIAAFLEGHPADNKVRFSIAGYTDATGSAAINKALAVKRMKRIEQLLVNQFAVPVGSVALLEPVTESAGTKKPVALNRKVIITLVK